LHDVCPQFALSDRLDGIDRKALAENFLKVPFEGFALRLLRSLLGFALELFNRAAHGLDRLILFDDLQPDRVIRLLAGFAADILATDPTIKACYLQLAGELRKLAGDPLPEQSDQQVEQLAERMAEGSRSKL